MILTVGALSVLVGCGGTQSESAQVRGVVQRYQAALANHNGSEMCSLLSSEAKHELAVLVTPPGAHGKTAFSCISFAKRLDEVPIDAKASARIREAKIGTSRVAGDKATVLVRELGEIVREVTLNKTPTGWKVTLPPPTSPTFDLLGEPAGVPVAPPLTVGGEKLAQFRLGGRVVAQSGCLACHRIGEAGNNGPGPDLTQVGGRLPARAIERAVIHPTAPMPSFRHLPSAKLRALVTFLSLLR